jgi:hypothetical protein
VPYRGSFILRKRLAVVALVTAGRLLVADDAAPTSPDGYKTVNVDTGGGKSLPIRVREDKDPYAAVSSQNTTGKYDPEHIFSQPSSMANKTFSGSSDVANSGHNDYNKSSRENTFITKPYTFDSKTSSVAGLDTKASYPTAPLSNRTSNDFGKTFTTASADLGPNQASTFASTKASEQGRTATLGGQAIDTPTSPLGDKTFTGDEAQSAKRHLTRLKSGQMYVQDLPNRPLTIDEVRDLINHGFKPDTDAKPPEEESKPLNDPAYVPKPLREAPEVTAPPSPSSDEDKDDPVPPPGTMSAPPPPENAQPLPER